MARFLKTLVREARDLKGVGVCVLGTMTMTPIADQSFPAGTKRMCMHSYLN
jgi:hypothetical protein